MRILRWVLLGLYLAVITALFTPVVLDSDDGDQLLVVVGLGILCQALFIFGAGTMQLCRPIRKHRLWMPICVAAFMLTLLLAGGTLALMELFYLDENEALVGLWLAGIPAAWGIWAVLLFIYARNWPRWTVLKRLTGLIFAGSLLELLASVPAHMIVSKRPGCLVGLGSMLGIIAGVAVMLFSFGPGIALLFLRDRHRCERAALPPMCQHCHYDLRANPAAVTCPECGAPVATTGSPSAASYL